MKKVFRNLLCVLLSITILISVFSAVVYALPTFEDDYGDYLYMLGYYESRNTYNVKNEYGYLGRWQLGHMALQDIGFMTDSNTYSPLAATYGVYSDDDFLNTPEAQDYCVQALHKKIWSYIRYYGDEKYLGEVMWDIRITISGMIAASHLVGVTGLHNMLKTGVVATDANGSTATFYLRELGGYNISKSIGTTIFDPDPAVTPGTGDKQATVNFYENYSGTNYLLGTDFSSSVDSSVLKSRAASVYSLSIDTTNKYENSNSLKVVGSSAGTAANSLYWATQTSGGTSEGYVGDSETYTLSFYAKASVSGASMYWRFGYGSEYTALNLTTSWKKYTLKITKKVTDGSVLHPYFNKAGTFYLNNVTLVDGSIAATLTTHESKVSKYSSQKGTVGKTLSSLPTPTRNGYVFDGWYTKKHGGTKFTTSSCVPAANINVYAHWTKVKTYFPEKTTSYGNHYYSVFNDDLTWTEAKAACERMGGHLVTITSSGENDFVKNLISSQTKGLYWIGAQLSGTTWKWITGESFSFKNWATGQPSGGESCGEIYSRSTQGIAAGKWNDVNEGSPDISYYSAKNTGYVCEFEPQSFSESGSFYHNGNLYKVFDSQISWENANLLANYLSGHLVTIGSSSENNYVKSIIAGGSADSYWIGLYDKNNTKSYSWVNGESFGYKNWSNGNPSFSGGVERYVEIFKDGTWNDAENIGRDSARTGVVIECDNYSQQLQSLTIVSMPQKTVYAQGESFDPTGLVIRANYEFGATKEVTDYTLSGYNANTLGVQTITVSYGGVKTQFKVTVVEKSGEPATGVRLDKSSLILAKGETYKLNATVYPEAAANKSVTWSTDNDSVATVSSDGTVSAVGMGNAVITVRTNDGSYTATCSVTVMTKFGKSLFNVLLGRVWSLIQRLLSSAIAE